MGSSRYCVYNRNREVFLGKGIPVVETTQEPFKALIEDLTQGAHSGVWLRPFRGIPEARKLPRFDLVYLDDEQRVIKASELFSVHEFAPFRGRVASAVVLPSGAIKATQTYAGDELKIAPAEDLEMASWLMQASSAKPPASSDNGRAALLGVKSEGGRSNRREDGSGNSREAMSRGKGEAGAKKKHSLFGRFLKWLNPEKDQRRAERRSLPGLVAYYWTGGAPQSFELSDISLTGIYLLTDERWVLETVLQMRLQITEPGERNPDAPANSGDPEDSIAVLAKVVRWGVDGVGFQFVYKLAGSGGAEGGVHGLGTDLQELLSFLRRAHLASNQG